MQKTSEANHTVLEREINRWEGFHRALRKEDREAFEDLMQIFRNNAHANEAAHNPFAFETMVMSILLAQQLRIKQLEKALQNLQPKTTPSTNLYSNHTHNNQTQRTAQGGVSK